jgi:hypothetical protein
MQRQLKAALPGIPLDSVASGRNFTDIQRLFLLLVVTSLLDSASV